MGKKLTPLQALNELRNNYVPVFNSRRMGKQQVVKSFAIIETKLKDYEELEETIGFDPTIFKQDFETLMKEHKASKIIKEKEVDLFSIKYTADFDRYNYRMRNSGFAYAHRLLTKEEYDLLKEVLS